MVVHDRKTCACARTEASPGGRAHFNKNSTGHLSHGGNGRQQNQDKDKNPMQGFHLLFSSMK